MNGFSTLADEPTTRSTPRGEAETDQNVGFDLVVADASWSWTERLFSPLATLGVRTLLLKACDWRNAVHQRRPIGDWFWPERQLGPNLWQRQFVLPSGWMKTYPKLGMRPLARAARTWHNALPGRRPLALAISYPHYLHLRDILRPDYLLYYNMDDYAQYWALRGDTIRRLERQAVREANLSVFCARTRADELAQAVPEAVDRVIHLPHGAPAAAIAESPRHRPAAPPPDLAAVPGPRLGFIGSMEDRVDWPLLGAVARAVPEASIVLIGREPRPAPKLAWYQAYLQTIALPNVYALGWKSQSVVGDYSAAFDVCLIPYQVDHPFNRASCPTKVMDYMATSRPVVSSAVPECRLSHHLFDVAESTDDFIAAVRRVLDSGSDDGRAAWRWQVARENTWEKTAERLLTTFQSTLVGDRLACHVS